MYRLSSFFVGAGACIPGIAGSGARIGSVFGRRYYSTGVNNSKKEEKIDMEDRTVVEYTENSKRSHKKDYSKMSKEDLLVEIGSLNTQLVNREEELKFFKGLRKMIIQRNELKSELKESHLWGHYLTNSSTWKNFPDPEKSKIEELILEGNENAAHLELVSDPKKYSASIIKHEFDS